MSDREKGDRDSKRAEIRQMVKKLCLLALAFVLVLSATSQGRRFWKEMFRISGFGGEIDAPLSIHFLNVGKADAILIECEGHTALVDAGTSVHGEAVVDYMARRRLSSLEYAIVSHPDKDHIGGMAQVLSEVPVDRFVRSQYFGKEYAEVNAVLRERSIPESVASPGDVLKLGEAALRVFGPLREYPDTNNSSLVIQLEYRGFTALLCGDIEKEAEIDLVKSGVPLTSTLLKVPHHGSKTSCTQKFLNAVNPEYAVISAGRDNNNLPTREILRRLNAACPDVYRTDTDGTIIFTYDGTEIHVLAEN